MRKARTKRSTTRERKDTSLRIMLTQEQKRALTRGAKKAGLDTSTWLRQLGLRAVGFLGEPEEPK